MQPTPVDRPSAPPPFDRAALDHYADMLAACRDHGLEPIVTLHHFVHPAWLGSDAWLRASTVDAFAAYVATAVRHVNGLLVGSGRQPVRYYLTINEPNMLVLNTYLGRQFPGRAPRGLHSAALAADHLLTAHVRAYNRIHDLYGEQGWGPVNVSLNNYCSDLYWLDKLLLDLLTLREHGVQPARIKDHVRRKAGEFGDALARAAMPLRKGMASTAGAAVKWLAHHGGHYGFDPEVFGGLFACLGASPRPRVLDFVALDYYDPFLAHLFRFPAWWDHEFTGQPIHARLMEAVTSKWWDWQVLPQGLRFFCRHYAAEYDRPVLIAENGMAIRRRKDNVHSRRADGMTRSQYLRLHADEVTSMLRDGVPLFGYLHWSLFDNYEWGTYTPRFGLFSLDYGCGTERFAIDPHGDCASQTYAEIVVASAGRRRWSREGTR